MKTETKFEVGHYSFLSQAAAVLLAAGTKPIHMGFNDQENLVILATIAPGQNHYSVEVIRDSQPDHYWGVDGEEPQPRPWLFEGQGRLYDPVQLDRVLREIADPEPCGALYVAFALAPDGNFVVSCRDREWSIAPL